MNFESSNPAMEVFKKGNDIEYKETMSVKGAVNKTMTLLFVTLISSIFTWSWVQNNPELMYPVMITGVIAGFIVALITAFKPQLANILGFAYAILEGLVLGPITMLLEMQYPGIGIQAVIVTIGIFMGMLLVYGYRIIRVTDKFKKIIIGLTFGVMIIYLISIVGNFLGFSVPYIHESGTVGILFSIFVVGLAAFNLLLDFDFIEKAVYEKYPKYMEWYGAFALLVTIIWLYIEVLKLIAKLRK